MMHDERVQESFWFSEFLRSATAVRHGLDNTPGAMASANIRHVLGPGMQRIRNSLGAPVLILSGFRSLSVNQAVRGSDTSQHIVGLAADFVCPQFGTPRTVARYIMERSGEIGFDQLIFEGQWVHVSFVRSSPRSQALTAHFFSGGGRTTYSNGIA